MALTVGSRIAHYDVTALIGEGGMGQVYQATDTKLNRQVALKILPEAFATDPDRLARFQREAQVLASLNHPNIAAIYGIEEQDDTRALVLELVEGPTLADRVSKGPIPLDEALPIAKQIAEALEAAHEAGVIHRDLKPANIKVREDGTVKVLDFGLAKALDPSPTGDPSQSPTLTAAATQMGVIMGTAAYMSPEQARGKQVDKRADIWAFGCVLFEMIAGRQVFAGHDATDILAAVIRAAPDWDTLPANPTICGLIARCLEKDPRSRWHDIADVRVDIERALANPDDARVESPVGTRAGRRRVITWSVATVALAFVTGITAWNLAPRPVADARPVRFSFDVASGPNQGLKSGIIGRVAISPDGRLIAYLGTRAEDIEDGTDEPVRQVFLRAVDASDSTPIAATEGAMNPFFSPDSAWVGFVAGGKIQKVPVSGGAPLEIVSASGLRGADWGTDDTIIYGSGFSGGLMQVSAAGGTPQPLTVPDPEKGEINHGFPEILPDGRTVLFAIGTGAGSRIARLSLDTGEQDDLSLAGSAPRYLSGGYVAFSENGNLRLVPFDLDTLQPRGSVHPAEEGIDAASWAGLEVASFDLSPAGDLVFVPGGLSSQTRPVWVNRGGRETPIDVRPGMYNGPAISPDGSRIAIVRHNEQGIGQVWVMNDDGSQPLPVAADGADYNPTWTPDGDTLTYTSDGDMFETLVDEDAGRTEFLHREFYQLPRSWSPDGQLAFVESSPAGSRIWVMSRDGDPEALTDAAFDASGPTFAPQGNWIAYHSNETGRVRVYVRRYPGSESAIPVSRGEGREPQWSRDGRELFYRLGNRMMSVEIQTEPELDIGEPVELWTHPYFSQWSLFRNYDVASDGRFLMLSIPDAAEAQTMTINVALDWFAEFERRTPVP